MKLEPKHLTPYLPYNLKMTKNGFVGELKTLCIDNREQSGYRIQVTCSDWWENNLYENQYKPLLWPLDLTEEITHNGETFVPIVRLKDVFNDFYIECGNNNELIVKYKNTHMYVVIDRYNDILQKLLEWHIDIYDLIPKGLAVDKNSVK